MRRSGVSWRTYAAELNAKAHSLHWHLTQVLPLARAAMEAMPAGSEERSKAAFRVISAQSALKEHDPT